jgi:hypothetical protein
MKKNTIAGGGFRGSAQLWIGALVLSALLATRAAAQGGEEPLTPAGRLRLSVAPVYRAWDSRFGASGSESLGTDLTDSTGIRLFPAVATLQERLREALEDPNQLVRLGTSNAYVSASRTHVPIRAELGVFDWLTVGVTVPLVQNRTEIELAFRADSTNANLGVNPALTRTSEVVAFTDELSQRQSAANARATSLCNASAGSPECAAARQVAQDGERLLTGFRSTYSASPFFPIDASPAAVELRRRLTTFNQGLTAQGLTPVARSPLFASARLTTNDLELILSDGAVGINTVPFANRIGAWELGDVELNVAVRVLERGVTTVPGQAPQLLYQVGGGALVRLGTGSVDDPDVFLDLSAGDGQIDMEGRVFASFRYGRGSLWTDLRYGVQQSRTLLRRVGPPDLVLIPAVNRAEVEWSPGSYLDFELVPRLHFSRVLAVTGSYHLFHKGEDAFTRITAVPEPQVTPPFPTPPVFPDVSLLAADTQETLHEVGAGLLFSTLETNALGLSSLPLEVRLALRVPIAGDGRYTPRGVRAGADLRLFFTLWGD